MPGTEIKSYIMHYYGGAKNTRTGFKFRAIIWLYGESIGKDIGYLFFHHNSTTMPAIDEKDANGNIIGHFRSEDFSNVLDILRNEKPVYLDYGENFKVAFIGTSQEPVGEGEVSLPT